MSLVNSGGWEESVYWHVYCTSVYCLLQGAICVYSVYTCLLQVEMPTKVAGDVYFSGWCLLQGAMCVHTSRPAVDTNSKGCLLQYMGCTAVCYLPSPPDRKPPHTHIKLVIITLEIITLVKLWHTHHALNHRTGNHNTCYHNTHIKGLSKSAHNYNLQHQHNKLIVNTFDV